MSDYSLGELSRQIANLIRVGEVTETDFTDPDAPRVKVAVSGFESDWLPFGANRAGHTKTWSPLSVGEQVLILSPREARMVDEAMAGAAQQFVAIEMGHQAAHANKELAMQLKEMRRHIAHLSSLVDPASA